MPRGGPRGANQRFDAITRRLQSPLARGGRPLPSPKPIKDEVLIPICRESGEYSLEAVRGLGEIELKHIKPGQQRLALDDCQSVHARLLHQLVLRLGQYRSRVAEI